MFQQIKIKLDQYSVFNLFYFYEIYLCIKK